MRQVLSRYQRDTIIRLWGYTEGDPRCLVYECAPPPWPPHPLGAGSRAPADVALLCACACRSCCPLFQSRPPLAKRAPPPPSPRARRFAHGGALSDALEADAEAARLTWQARFHAAPLFGPSHWCAWRCAGRAPWPTAAASAPRQVRLRIAAGVEDALNFLHRGEATPALHMDIKAANVVRRRPRALHGRPRPGAR